MFQSIYSVVSGRFRLALLLAFLILPITIFAQSQQTVTGTVTDETGEPLIGATVMVTGTSVGSSTDFDGNYSIKLPAGANN